MGIENRKVIVLGIDGATFDVITPLAAAGRLPNFSKLMQRGVHGTLLSTVPVVSAVAWTSFMTGRGPVKHQIFDFCGKVPGAYDFIVNTAKTRTRKPFWMNLTDLGKRVFVVGVTMSYPPDPVNGYMISGLGIPSDEDTASYVHPKEFAEELVKNVGPYRSVPDVKFRSLNSSDSEKEKFINAISDQVDYRIKLFKYMWAKEKFDFSMLFFLDTDGASHYFWKYMDPLHRAHTPGPYADAIYRVYEKIDSALGEIMVVTGGEADLVLVSDHGFGPLNKVVFLNNWLRSKGYLEFNELSFIETTSNFLKKAARRAKGLITGPGRSIGDGPGARIGGEGSGKFVWRKTKAFFNGTVGNIFINLKGREPEGIVEPADYTSFCNELVVRLMSMEDPVSKEKIVQSVERYRAIETDSTETEATRTPDLHVSFKSGYSAIGEEIALHNLKDTGVVVADSNNWSGAHEPEGIFIAAPGEAGGIRQGSDIEGARIIDVAPTLLYMLGAPVPRDMDGRLLDGIFTREYLDAHPVVYSDEPADRGGPSANATAEATDTPGEGDDEEVLKRLRDLGYID